MAVLHEWKEVRLPGPKDQRCGKWHAPQQGYMKVNVDTSFFADSTTTGVGMIIHDEEGEFMACRMLQRTGIMKLVDEAEAWGSWKPFLG